MDTLLRDVRHTVRSLARTPGFTAVAVLVLAVGIGTATAGFSVANWLLWRPVPGIRDDGRLATVWMGRWNGGGFEAGGLSYPNYLDLTRSVTALSGIAANQSSAVALASNGVATRRVDAQFVTPNYFGVIGAQLQQGRVFTAAEDLPPNGTPVAVISDRLWASSFNRDPAILGRTLRLNGRTFTVIGVAAPGFHGSERLGTVDVWLPITQEFSVRHLGRSAESQERAIGRMLYLVARLAPGATFEQAQAQLNAATRHLAELYPDANQELAAGTGAVLFPGIGTNPLARGSITATMRLLVGITALVLLIACANVANLLLFRGIATRQEMAVQRALGAGLGRLVRQQLLGSVLLASTSGALGVLLSVWLVQLFQGVRFTAIEVRDISVDWRVLAFACGASLAAGVIAGLMPALTAARADPLPGLRRGGPTETGRRTPLRAALAVTQLALGVTLVVGALLFTRTLQRLAAVDIGFDANGVTIVWANPDDQGYSPERVRVYWAEFTRQLRATPGVQEVALATSAPFSGMTIGNRVKAEDGADVQSVDVVETQMSPSYFRLLKIPLLRGLGFADADSGRDVVVLSQALATRLFGAADPLGHFVELVAPRGPGVKERVAGVTADTRVTSLGPGAPLLLYRPLTDFRMRPFLLVRSVLSNRETAAAIDRVAANLDSALPVSFVTPLPNLVARYLSEHRLFALVLSVLALVALGLAAAGLYGLVGFGVALRAREFGIRAALGAEPGTILRLVLREAMALAAVGVPLGLGGAALGTRLIQSRLFGVSALDPISYLGAAGALALVVLIASVRPARMATRVDPVKALKSE
jgi:predicted permease